MSDRWQALLARIDALTLRERGIVFVAGLLLLMFGWYLGWAEHTLGRSARIHAEREALQNKLENLQAEVAQRRVTATPQGAAEARLQSIGRRSAEVQARIDEYTAELISPTEMARLLEKILERRHALRLVRLANLGAEDLLPEDVPGEQRLYRHRFEMQLEGPYLQCLAYLEDLEALPWRLYWQSLDIEAGDYPNNRIRIEVATLSLDEDWIGV